MNSKLPADQNQPQATQKQQDVIAENKKVKEAIGSLYKEAGPERVIEQREFETPPELKEYVTEIKKEGDIDLQVPIEDEFGQILMESARPSKPKIYLPLDDQGILGGMKQKVNNSVRWLVTWCLRLIKMFPQRVFYQKSQKTSTKSQINTNDKNTNNQKA